MCFGLSQNSNIVTCQRLKSPYLPINQVCLFFCEVTLFGNLMDECFFCFLQILLTKIYFHTVCNNIGYKDDEVGPWQ